MTHERARHATCSCRRPRASSALICTLRPAALAPPPRACASRTTQAGPPRLSARGAGTKEGYSGYGAEQGMGPLREKIASALYDGKVDAAEVFVSDGSKCDIGRLQMMFGSGVTSAVQDPSYPVYVDTSVIMGQVRSHCPRDAIVTGRSSQVHAAAALQRPPTAHWRSRGGASSHSRRDRASERHLPPPPPRRRTWTPRASSTATSSTCTASLDALSLSLDARGAEDAFSGRTDSPNTRSTELARELARDRTRSPRDHLEITRDHQRSPELASRSPEITRDHPRSRDAGLPFSRGHAVGRAPPCALHTRTPCVHALLRGRGTRPSRPDAVDQLRVRRPCNPSNNFFPDLSSTPRADVVYFCSPNNPTGAAASREQLQQLVDWCNKQACRHPPLLHPRRRHPLPSRRPPRRPTSGASFVGLDPRLRRRVRALHPLRRRAQVNLRD